MRYCLKLCFLLLLLTSASTPVTAHHSIQLYDKATLVTIEGTITKAKFGFPHSRYYIEIEDSDDKNKTLEWLMTAQDPKDAKRFGYFNELEALKVGDRINVVGWPHKNNEREVLGQRMTHKEGKTLELVPLSGYVRSTLYASMDAAVLDPNVLKYVSLDNLSLSETQKVFQWSQKDNPVARAAAEYQLKRAQLIGFSADGFIDFPGMPTHLACQTEEGNSTVIFDKKLRDISDQEMRKVIQFLQIYNRVLAKHWELSRTSCGQ